ncbi:sulfatase-like hydrolase/transferase [Methanimicrococcus hongohii]|uniref:sulfatase-like hydrolase/transferase n=1 Tax=Methanimicrococcus hongohii TaxID=3028295 RepID=UPI00292E821E|nr:sulfatase-like hydrolase/transferase [Methanimicrococcus sp. Hf6]
MSKKTHNQAHKQTYKQTRNQAHKQTCNQAHKQTYMFKRTTLLKLLLLSALLFALLSPIGFVSAAEPGGSTFYTNLNEHNSTPDGAVFFIVDGLGSYYLFPELKGETLSGESIQKAAVPVLTNIWNSGFRISEMKVPVPVTEKGHSVLVTGNPSADSEMVGYTDSSFMDILREEGFLCIGVMQRGDFESMRGKFDVIIYDKTNSVNNMDFTVQTNSFEDSNPKIVSEIASVFNSQKNRASSYMDSKDTSEKYAGYNRWGIDTAYEVLTVMEKYPGQKFIVVVNVGAVDSTGHYRGYYAYLDAVERLDKDLGKLFEKCRRNNLFFIFTADHGMSFEEQNKKSGGHSSTKYAKTKEALYIPFIVYGNSIQKNIYYSETGQEDAAPTLLSLFNIAAHPRFSKGNVLPAKEKPTLYVEAPESVQIQLYQVTGGGEQIVFNSLGFDRSSGYSSYSVAGLEQGNYLLKWNAADSSSGSGSKIKYSQEEAGFYLTADMTIDLSDYSAKSSDFLPSMTGGFGTSGTGFGSDSGGILSKFTKPVYFLLIAIINIIGAAGIYYLYKKEGFSKL